MLLKLANNLVCKASNSLGFIATCKKVVMLLSNVAKIIPTINNKNRLFCPLRSKKLANKTLKITMIAIVSKKVATDSLPSNCFPLKKKNIVVCTKV